MGELVTTQQAADHVWRSPATIRQWASRRDRCGRRLLEARSTAPDGRPLYDLDDVLDAERDARKRDRTGHATAAIDRHARRTA
jgi:hypothetical protein